VPGVESFEDLTPVLATEFESVPSVGPGQSIFRFPDMVIKALGCLRRSETVDVCVGEIQGQQTGQVRRIAVADPQCVAELAHARIPAIAGVEGNVTPSKTKI